MRAEITVALGLFAVSAGAAEPVEYERDIQPLFFHKCSACHGALEQSGGLRLDAGALIREGGDGGPAISPGDSDRSLLIERVAETDPDLRMPPEGEGEPLTAAQISLLRRWIDSGAESPADEPIPEDPANYWSYQRIERPAVPVAAAAGWSRNPVDAFIAAKHQQLDLAPSQEVAREVWLRRVYLDLVGLPPTRDELRKFLADDSPTADAAVVDSLLQRPEYGQRWGRHWMDVWRYSDWYGSRASDEVRYSQRHIWRWRDWIIESLAADKPYDVMLGEMLAGDELAPEDPDVLRATGFLGRNWYKFDRNVWMFETVEQTSQAFLGMTLRCARCHDHKYDPISQQDYYRFRAFFEPHDVRTDTIFSNPSNAQDAPPDSNLVHGLARVFDKEPEAATFLFQRGDSRSPDTSQPLSPGVPAAMGTPELQIHPVALPPETYYPSLRPEIAEGIISAADAKVREARQRVSEAEAQADNAEQALATHRARLAEGQAASGLNEPATATAEVPPALRDTFAAQSDRWQIVSGNWTWTDGKLVESSVSDFATIVSAVDHPRNFRARIQYRTLQPGNYRSVGFSFDYVDQGNSQDVYTTANDATPAIQAFHRQDGKQVYPEAAIVRAAVAVGEIVTVEATARGQQLTISLNGQQQLEYEMPVARRDGKLALWVHQGGAEFLEIDVQELLPSLADLQRTARDAADGIALARRRLEIAQAEAAAVRARVAAERVKYLGHSEPTAGQTATSASRAERQVAVAKAELAVLEAEQEQDRLLAKKSELTDQSEKGQSAEGQSAEPVGSPDPAPASPAQAAGTAELVAAQEALTAAQEAVTAARQALDAAQMAAANPDGHYAPLGEVFPSTSTGRRLALARWITSRENPRTARVAVNHLWLRHFGEALVPTVANFGLNGQTPSHPELLDWLAVELMDNGWRMKPLHRMMVLSAAYRQSSAAGGNDTSHSRDPENRFLWRMNSRRMEAEVVRDSVLSTAGVLDLRQGGPEIPEDQGQTLLRRSVYFRNTPNETMQFLEIFDGPNPNACYRRQQSVVPHQALALMNSSLALDQARLLAARLSESVGPEDDLAARAEFISAAMETVLSRAPTPRELEVCQTFLEKNAALVADSGQPAFPAGRESFRQTPSASPSQRARENLIHVLYSHNDFVTIR